MTCFKGVMAVPTFLVMSCIYYAQMMKKKEKGLWGLHVKDCY